MSVGFALVYFGAFCCVSVVLLCKSRVFCAVFYDASSCYYDTIVAAVVDPNQPLSYWTQSESREKVHGVVFIVTAVTSKIKSIISIIIAIYTPVAENLPQSGPASRTQVYIIRNMLPCGHRLFFIGPFFFCFFLTASG